MDDQIKIRIRQTVLNYKKSDAPHSKASFASTALSIQFLAPPSSVRSAIIKLTFLPTPKTKRNPLVAAVTPESFRNGVETRSDRIIRPGWIFDTKKGGAAPFHSVSHLVDWTRKQGPADMSRFVERKDLVVTAAGVETNVATWRISGNSASNKGIPSEVSTAVIVVHRGPFIVEAEACADVNGHPYRSITHSQIADDDDDFPMGQGQIGPKSKLYLDAETVWDDKLDVRRKIDDEAEKQRQKEEEERIKREEEQKAEEIIDRRGPKGYAGGVDEPA